MMELLRKLGLPEAISVRAAGVDSVISWVHILMAILLVGWGAFFITAVIRFRRSRNPQADYAGVKSHFSTYAEAAVALFEIVLLVAFSFPVWASRVEEIPDPDYAEVVRIVAQQFKWNIHYPGPDGVFGTTSPDLIDDQALNFIGLDRTDPAAQDDIVPIQGHLHLPVGQPALLYLTTRDVIHSFFIPVMRVKQDAVPGMRIPVWFTPTKPGSWEIACAQLCGNSHYEMKGYIHIHSQKGYEAYMDALSLVYEIDDYDLTYETEKTLKEAVNALRDGDPARAEQLAVAAKSQAQEALAQKETYEEEWDEWKDW
ncbi:MAG: cytochrome c oxidase subunit II [Fidelibacterota bacterium]